MQLLPCICRFSHLAVKQHCVVCPEVQFAFTVLRSVVILFLDEPHHQDVFKHNFYNLSFVSLLRTVSMQSFPHGDFIVEH